jgi:SapC
MTPITPDTCGTRGWIPARDFAFARGVTWAPLAIWEIVRAAQTVPVVFMARDEEWTAIAVMGTTAGANAFVSSEGRWCTDFVPAPFRLYPFCLDPRGAFCLSPDAEPDSAGAPGARRFFEDGKLTPQLLQARRLLTVHARGVQAVGRTMSLLKSRSALLPGDESLGLRCRSLPPGAQTFVVDTERLNALDDADILSLFRSGALRWLHAHIDSLHRLDHLDRIGRRTLAVVPTEEARATVTRTEADPVADLVSAIVSDLGDADLRSLIGDSVK